MSTAGQAEEGVSLEAQKAKIRAWADLNGYDQVELFNEGGLTGKTMDKREALQAALTAVNKGDAFVVYSLSRLARNTKHTLDIADSHMDKSADLVSITERIDTTTAAGKMVFRLLAVLAEFERDQVAERTTFAMRHKKAKGERVGAVPYGHRLLDDGKSLEEHPQEQTVITEARRLQNAGLSLRGIAGELARQGFRARNGDVFKAEQIRRMLAA